MEEQTAAVIDRSKEVGSYYCEVYRTSFMIR
jgi:hypothetical protein